LSPNNSGSFFGTIAALEFAKDNLRVLDSAQFACGDKGRIARKYDPIDPTIRKKAIAVVTPLKTVAASGSNPLDRD